MPKEMRAVPNTFLIGLAAIHVIPATSMIVYSDGLARGGGISLLLLFLFLALFDFQQSRNRLGLIRIEFPELLRSTKGKTAELVIRPAGRSF